MFTPEETEKLKLMMPRLHWELQRASIDRMKANGEVKIMTAPAAKKQEAAR